MPSAADPRAIFFGVVVDHALTWLASRFFSGATLELLMAAGLAATMLGGFVSGRVAGRAGALQGTAVGLVALAIGVLSEVGPIAELPDWYMTSMFLLLVPAGALGGWLARKPFDGRAALF